MCKEEKSKCSERTRDILKAEKKKIMKETLESLKSLRETFTTKQVA